MNFKVTKARPLHGFETPPHTLGLTDPRKMFEYAKRNYDDWRKLPGDERLAMNAVFALNHVFDWVWAFWLHGNEERQKAIGMGHHWACQVPPKPEEDFWEWVFEKSQWNAEVVRSLANGAKHATGDAPTTAGDKGMAMMFNHAKWSEDPTPLDQDDPLVTFGYEVQGKKDEMISQGFLRDVLFSLIQFWTEFMNTTAKDW